MPGKVLTVSSLPGEAGTQGRAAGGTPHLCVVVLKRPSRYEILSVTYLVSSGVMTPATRVGVGWPDLTLDRHRDVVWLTGAAHRSVRRTRSQDDPAPRPWSGRLRLRPRRPTFLQLVSTRTWRRYFPLMTFCKRDVNAGVDVGRFDCQGGLFPKSTVGASSDAGLVTSKYSRGFAPVIFAVRVAGKLRMYVLY